PDRMKDIIITAGGKNITPSEIENQLKFSPYISDAVVIGDRRKFLSCLVMIDHETVAQFAQERNVPFTNFASLCRAKEVQDLIWGEIERVNGRNSRLVVEDTQYQVPRAVQAGTKLINRDHIFAMVAPLGTPMNNALFKDQFEAGVPNLFPLSAARSMYEPFHRLKFYGAASYVDQVRAGINCFVSKKGKKALCAMYQDTDFGKEVLDGVQLQAEKMRIKLVETTTHKPTDQDFTAPITKLKAAGCDLVVLGTIVRDSIVPYATARKIGWTDVDFLGSAATYG